MQTCTLCQLLIAITQLTSPAWTQLSGRALMELAFLEVDDVRYELLTTVTNEQAAKDLRKDWRQLKLGNTGIAGRGWFGDIWNGVTGIWTKTWEGIKTKAQACQDAIVHTGEYIVKLGVKAVHNLEVAANYTTEYAALGVDVVKALVTYVAHKVIQGFNELMEYIDKGITAIKEKIKNGESAWQVIKSGFQLAVDIFDFARQRIVDYFEAEYADGFLDLLLMIFQLTVTARQAWSDSYKAGVDYENDLMGKIDVDDPIMSFGYKPDTEKDVKVLMHLQNTVKCPENPKEMCLQHMEIDFDNITENKDKIPECHHLTVTIHGWREHPNHALSEALGEYYHRHHESFCNLAIDWSSTAGGVYIWQINYLKEGESN